MLPATLPPISRADLASWWTETQQVCTDPYYRDCIARWSHPRYALDTRFVQLTLLLDRGETAQGPRWQASERFRALAEVLEHVRDHQAIVLLGPPGSGKSTLLRHYAMDQARTVLDGGEAGSRADAPFWLPTEAEWEAAARGMAGRRYAYGHDYDPACCNTFDTHIRRTTPIGVFPGGETLAPAGIADMMGNVWEWTSSLYQPYPYDAADGREAPSADELSGRVVRCGSWSDGPLYARACYRLDRSPTFRSGLIGFRVCCSSSIRF